MFKKGNIPWNKGIKTNKSARNSLDLVKDDLYRLYINDRLSTTDIARLYHCSSTSILNWLKRYDIPVRSDSEAVKINRSKWSAEKELCRSRKYHNTWVSKSQEDIDIINQKRRDNPNINSPEAIKKATQTRIAHGTSRQSKAENDFYKKLLLLGFDESDIIRHYTSDYYPFDCDFYIKSKDLYVEYQGHFTHGYEPFDKTNTAHIEWLTKMQNSGKDMTTWCVRDPYKLSVAKSNKINLLLVYPKHKNYLVRNGQLTTIDINSINKI